MPVVIAGLRCRDEAAIDWLVDERAERALGVLAAGPGERAAILAAARSYGEPAAEAVTALLDRSGG